MIYSVRHRTTYTYDSLVGFARCNLRLTPEDGAGQTLLGSEIEVLPIPAETTGQIDFFGAWSAAVTVVEPHRELVIEARSEVRVERQARLQLQDHSWEAVRDGCLETRDMRPTSPVHFLMPSRRVPLLAAATAYARDSFPPGRALLDGAVELMERIRRDFAFDAKATTVATPLATVAATRRGVCQDFAHFMIAGLRGLGLPAAYVSGYLRTVPPPGQKRLRGADASHAWVAVWSGDGWVDLDPTNAVLVRDDHIVVARGRDYGDVCPVDGIILVSGDQDLAVEVDVIPHDEAG